MFCQLAARVSFMSADESGQRAMIAFWGIVPCRELRFVDRMLRPACALSQRTPARRRNEVWIKPFQRFAGSQGRALSRPSQRAKSPFETRCPTRVLIKLSFSARPQTRNSLRPMAAHENQPADWFSVLRLRRSPFSVHGLAEQVGHSLVGKRPTGAFSNSARFPLEGGRKARDGQPTVCLHR